MEIRFVNHASFICEHNGIRLICDPWLYGSAFNDGWDLVTESRFAVEDFASIQYIWFSHEHPDHFSPRILLDVPKGLRPNITILYKETPDGKVLAFCKKQGFATRELRDGIDVGLGRGLSVRCGRVPLHDSWLLIQSPNCRVLNLNDAVIERPAELRRLRSAIGPLDVLFTQFSYAAWRGNPKDTDIRASDARQKLSIMTRQIRGLEPKFTVPFASFSFFSHEENYFTSDSANKPHDAVAAIETTKSVPVLLFPDDRWEVGAPHENATAEAKYNEAYAALAARPLRKSASVPLKTLAVEATRYIERVQRSNDARMLSLLRRTPLLPLLRPVEIYLWDLDTNVRFSFERGLEAISWRSARYDLRMGSDSLHFLLKNAWGVDTLTVNGRFHADAGGLKQLIGTFGLDALNNAGIRLTPSFLLDSATTTFLLRILARKLWSLRAQSRRANT